MSRKKLILAALLLFLLNVWISGRLFRFEFVDHMNSIEGTHIALGRWVSENWRDLSWFPLWYGGIPYQNTYPPLHHWIVGLVSSVGDVPPARAYHAVTAVFYSLGPVTLFLFAAWLSRSVGIGFLAGLVYSVFSPSTLLIPIVRYDAGGVWGARRLQTLVQYGEGPHIASMTLLPLVLLLVIVAVERRHPAWSFAASLGLASVALTNYLGAASLALAVVAWLFASDEIRLGTWLRAAMLGLYAYALACSWLPPSTLLAISRNERYLSGTLPPSRWLYLALMVLGAAALLWLLRRVNAPPQLRFAALFLTPLAAFTLASEWWKVSLMPQGHRYHLEMEMALVLTGVFGARYLLERSSRRLRVAAACLLVVLCVYPAIRYRKCGKRLIRPVDITQRIEYREARWAERNMAGRRVMLPGSVGFFLNVFTDTPQFAGGFDQGIVNPNYAAFHYQLLTGENAGNQEGTVAVTTLKAFGVDAVGVSGPRSREVFKPFRNPRKFDGLLRELWRDADDVIYDVGRRSKSLAHVIRRADLPARAPIHGLDLDPMRPYVAALDDPALPAAEMKWSSRHSAVVSASIEPGQVLSVQISYHPGWSATVAGAPVRLYGDALGQIVVEPGCEGPCTVELVYDGGMEMRVARIVSWSALIGGILFAAFARRRMRA
ncbi:MAG TPA: hypothetical protein VLE22_10975 [Bryobacteraceae bacterium]|nr:hypothetical protein [Bryobacteraceae bacterium]